MSFFLCPGAGGGGVSATATRTCDYPLHVTDTSDVKLLKCIKIITEMHGRKSDTCRSENVNGKKNNGKIEVKNKK